MPNHRDSRSGSRSGRDDRRKSFNATSRSRSRRHEHSTDSSSSGDSSDSTAASSVSSYDQKSSRRTRKTDGGMRSRHGKVPIIIASVKMAKDMAVPCIDELRPRLEVHTKGWREPADPQAAFNMTQQFSLAVERHDRNGDRLPKDGERLECEFYITDHGLHPHDRGMRVPLTWQFKRSKYDPEPRRFGAEERRSSRSATRDRDGNDRRSRSATRERRSEPREKRRSMSERGGGRRKGSSRY